MRLHLPAFLLLFLSSISCFAASAPRTLLSLWSKKETILATSIPVHKHVEPVLNHLGLKVDYLDIDTETIPDPRTAEFTGTYSAVLTYFTGEEYAAAPKLFEFFSRLASTEVRWIVLNRFGFTDVIPEAELKKLFLAYGLIFHGMVNPPLMTKTLVSRTKDLEFERKLQIVDNSPVVVKPDAKARHWLKTSDYTKTIVSSQVFTSKKISLAYGNYGLVTDQKERRLWQLDPFLFFSEALGLDRAMPVPDVNVLNGRRVFFSHIDGDAFVSLSLIDPSKYCGEIVETEILRAYSTLPFGVSFVAAELARDGMGNDRILEIARRMMELPNVEPASHTYFHPLVWRQGKLSYFPEKNKYDEKREITGAVEFLQKNVAGPKPVETIYWSGDCAPTESALRAASQAKLLNMNGGDSRFDSTFPSIAYISPLGRAVGKQFQVYSGNANDNVYTNGWEGPFYGFGQVVETFERTGSPRILKPVNPYFHFFSAERKEGLDALKKALEWAHTHPIAPIFPSAYVRSVLAWNDAKFAKIAPNRYQIDVGSDLNTLRIDEPGDLLPDLLRSRHVIGYSSLNGALYLHLAPLRSTPVLVELVPRARAERTNPPFLESVGGVVLSAESTPKQLRYKLAPFTRGPLIVRNLKTRSVTVQSKPVSVQRGSISWEFTSSDRATEVEITL